MTDRRFYTIGIPSDTVIQNEEETRRNVFNQGSLSAGPSPVEPISVDPGQRSITVTLRALHAEKMAHSLEELFRAQAISSVPFYGISARTSEDGYYSLNRIRSKRFESRGGPVFQLAGSITRMGTRQSHYRAVTTNPVKRENSFGNGTTAEVGIPASASKTRWLKRDSRETEIASPTATRTGEYGDVQTYDAQNSSFGAPALIFELDYQTEGDMDARVWDSCGNSSDLDSNGLLQWEKVYAPEHEFSGTPLVENGLLRLSFEETLGAERWDTSTSSWTATSLGSSDWELFDFDLVSSAPQRIRAQVTFKNASTSETYRLNLLLHSGWPDAQWLVPENEVPPAPTGLQTLLDPIAATSTLNPQPSRTLKSYQEVRA